MLAAVICAASHRLETKVEAHKLYPPIPSRDGRRVLKSIDVVRNALRILRAAITRGDKQNINTESLELKTQRSCEYEFRSSGAVLISLPRKPLRDNSPAAGSPGDLSTNVLGQVHFPEDAPPANASRSLTCS